LERLVRPDVFSAWVKKNMSNPFDTSSKGVSDAF